MLFRSGAKNGICGELSRSIQIFRLRLVTAAGPDMFMASVSVPKLETVLLKEVNESPVEERGGTLVGCKCRMGSLRLVREQDLQWLRQD